MSDFGPFVPTQPTRVQSIIRKYTSPDPALAGVMARSNPATTRAVAGLDVDRVRRGQAPYTQNETAVGLRAADTNEPVVPRQDQGLFQNALTDVKAFFSSIPKLPGIVLNEGQEIQSKGIDVSGALSASNPLEALGNLAMQPGIRFIPGSFVASNFRTGGPGVSGLAEHPVFTALDVLPYAETLAKLTPAARLAPELAHENAVYTLPGTGFEVAGAPARTTPLRSALRYTRLRPGGVELEPFVDPITKLEIPGHNQLAPNLYGRFLEGTGPAMSHVPFVSSAMDFGRQAFGRPSRDMAQASNRAIFDDYVGPLEEALAGKPISNPSAAPVVEPLADVLKLMRDSDLEPSAAADLYRRANEATDRSAFLASLNPTERAYADRIIAAQDAIRDHMVNRGDLTPVSFSHGTEFYPTAQAKPILRARDRAAFLDDMTARRAAVENPGDFADQAMLDNAHAELGDVLTGNSAAQSVMARKSAARANLSYLEQHGYDISSIRSAINKARTRADLEAIARDPMLSSAPSKRATVTALDDAVTAGRTLPSDPVAVQFVDRVYRGDWQGAMDRARTLARRKKFGSGVDWSGAVDELATRVQAAKVVDRFDRMGLTEANAAKAQARVASVEAASAPARFSEYVRSQADDAFLKSLQSRNLSPEDKLRAAEFVSDRTLGRLVDIDPDLRNVYTSYFEDASRSWQAFAEAGVDPLYVHKVTGRAAKQMQNPSVLNFVPGESQLKERGGSIEQLTGVPDLAISVTHQAHEILTRTATEGFLDWLGDRMGVDGNTLAARYEPVARAISDRTGRPMDEVVGELVSRDWAPFNRDSYLTGEAGARGKTMAGGRPEPLTAFSDKQVFIPRDVSANLQRLLPTEPSSIARALSAPMKVFRTAVLPLSPRWHINNILGGGILATITDPAAWRYARRAWKMARENELAYKEGAASGTREMREAALWGRDLDASRLPLNQRLAIAHQYNAGGTLGRVLSETVDRLGDRGTKWIKPAVELGKRGVQWSYDVNQVVDDFYRSMMYLSGESKALKAGMSVAEAERAGVALSRDILQNWDRLTPLERGVIRTVFPFYSWAAHVIRFVAKYPGDHPWRTSIMASIANTEWNDHLSGVPEKLRDLMFIGSPDASGMVTGISLGGANPFRDVSSYPALIGFLTGQKGGDASAITGQVNPFIGATLTSLGIDPSGGPDLYPDLEYDPETGGLRVAPKSFPMALLGSILPQARTVADLAGFNQDFKSLALTNPEAAKRRLASGVGIPVFTKTVNMDQEQAKQEILVYRQMQADKATALKTGDVGLMASWPALRTYQQALNKLTNKAPYTPPAQAESPAVLALKAPLAVLAGQTG